MSKNARKSVARFWVQKKTLPCTLLVCDRKGRKVNRMISGRLSISQTRHCPVLVTFSMVGAASASLHPLVSNYQKSIRKVSENYQKSVRKLSGKCPETVRKVSEKYQKSVRKLLETCQKTIRILSRYIQRRVNLYA